MMARPPHSCAPYGRRTKAADSHGARVRQPRVRLTPAHLPAPPRAHASSTPRATKLTLTPLTRSHPTQRRRTRPHSISHTRMDSDPADDVADAATSAGGEESWARTLLRRGWDLSRKAAIAGVAATAAPVVAPPVLILSIAGVALSVPFAACLATVAAADRLTAALLPPAAPPQLPCCYTHHQLGNEESEQEFVDASGGPDDQEESPVLGYRSKTDGEDVIVELEEGFASSLPLSQEPRISEELVPLLADEEGVTAEGEFASQKSGPELFVSGDGKHDNESGTAKELDSEYITMEAPSPGDVSVLGVPTLCDEESMVRTMEEDAPVPAPESVGVLPVPDNDNRTEDGKSATTGENESSNEVLSRDLDAAESSDLLSPPMLATDDIVVLGDVKGEDPVRKSGQDFHGLDTGDITEHHKITEVMPPHEVDASESLVLDESMVPIKLEDELAVDMAPQEELRHTNPVTSDVSDVQLDDTSTATPAESDSLQSRLQVAPELLATTESTNVHGTLGSNVTEGIVKDVDDKTTESVEHYGEKGVPSMVTMNDDKDLDYSRSRPNVSAIIDGMTSVGSKPHAERPDQTIFGANKEHGKEKLAEDKCVKTEKSKTMDDKVSDTDMAAQADHTSKSLEPDYQSTREDEATVEMVLEEVTSSIDPVTGEVVEVRVDIIARESETLPMSDLVAQDLKVVTEAGTVDDKTEDIVKAISITETKVVDMEHQSGEGSSSFVTVTSVVTMDDDADLMSTRSTAYVSAISDDTMSVQGRPGLQHHHQTTGVEHKVMCKEFETQVPAEDKDIYTEEQLREEIDTLRTITGYRAVPSLTLEGDLAGLYIFVGVEPPHSSGGAASLTVLNTKLRFLKSIIGVE
ncbi:hypothetical protein QOZ80_9AG0682210 [Eleusine coracana subsp. coracana]|nr:hypothetical protein QOZ80_9AG0682210 [Eleusine coracana subsp. coracana]